MTEQVLGTTIKAYCGRCGGERNCEIKGFHAEGGAEENGYFSWNTNWYLLVCKGCEYPFAQSVSSDSESYYDYYDEDGRHVSEIVETIETWPAKAKRKRPDWFEHYRVEGTHIFQNSSLNTAMGELYRSLDAGLLVLSSIGIRTAFDAASEALGIEPGLQFVEKLDALVESGKIRASEKEALEVLIGAGSAAAHRGWQPEPEQLDMQMDILEEFIFNSMVLPAREKTRVARVAKLRESVPEKPKRPKRKRTTEKDISDASALTMTSRPNDLSS
ncbi:DUF4145 domain-containing protein [Spirulina subsalsa FACHB-351]|jgi:hypothetical protein|uniref:DUF4145 domain-containing protein n=1 Tax=Spirulina subsalsa FACHB-351 TaxID=234711 RepID=A0ABT3L7I4_9CYAN|nr:DUF4145 domain-containing protein [Spirulina subsalsa FACHB-351]